MSPTDPVMPTADRCPTCGGLRVTTRALESDADDLRLDLTTTSRCRCHARPPTPLR